ncbi:GNAT family N-acetyltransferase [Pseudomonas sp. AA-38]|uniref:GNAT family N-acetyltransferase n=1 Tax=Pseudomonas sp. AA-38 TaxID=3028807 RepID=UPI0023F71B2D|nr:GNAT family N-acetyltransferase [Pseudomonas sp. AA-38]
MEFVAEATEQHLAQFTEWLKAEWIATEHQGVSRGFYCNLNIIQKAYAEGRLSCLIADGECIGFVSYNDWSAVVRLDTVEVHPGHRGKGAGRLLVEEFINHQLSKGSVAAEVECVPWESHYFWRKLGFLDIPEGVDTNHYFYERLKLYRPLHPQPAAVQFGEHCFELWDKPAWEADDSPARWEWAVSSEDGRIHPPLIYPCNREWKFRWCTAGVVRFEGAVKRLKYNNLTYDDEYLTLTHFPGSQF